MGRRLGAILCLVAIGLWYGAWKLDGGEHEALLTWPRILGITGGVVFSFGFGLLLFRKIILGPWLTIDLVGAEPALILGPPFFRLRVKDVPMPSAIQVGAYYVTISYLTRLTLRLAIAAIPYRLLIEAYGWRWALTGGIIAFILVTGAERGLYKALGAEPPEDANSGILKAATSLGDEPTEA